MNLPLPTNAREIRNPKGSGDERFIQVDRWNRYVLPDPVTGQERSWTRVTTAAKAMEDTYNLSQWQMRMVAYGIAISPHLVMQAASFKKEDVVSGDDKNVKKDLQDIAQRALEAAGGDQGARVGTGLHNFTDRIDHGEKLVFAPAPYDKAIEAYVRLLQHHKLRTNPDWIERVIVVPELGLAGKLDRLLEIEGFRELLVGDLKSQKTMEFGSLGIALQQAAYAHATFVWDVDAEIYTAPPPINQELALVMHVPSTRPGEATLHGVDIVRGWELLNLAIKVRAARSEKNLTWEITQPLTPPTSAMENEAEREAKAIELLAQARFQGELEIAAEMIKQHIWTSKIQDFCADLWTRLPAGEGISQ